MRAATLSVIFAAAFQIATACSTFALPLAESHGTSHGTDLDDKASLHRRTLDGLGDAWNSNILIPALIVRGFTGKRKVREFSTETPHPKIPALNPPPKSEAGPSAPAFPMGGKKEKKLNQGFKQALHSVLNKPTFKVKPIPLNTGGMGKPLKTVTRLKVSTSKGSLLGRSVFDDDDDGGDVVDDDGFWHLYPRLRMGRTAWFTSKPKAAEPESPKMIATKPLPSNVPHPGQHSKVHGTWKETLHSVIDKPMFKLKIKSAVGGQGKPLPLTYNAAKTKTATHGSKLYPVRRSDEESAVDSEKLSKRDSMIEHRASSSDGSASSTGSTASTLAKKRPAETGPSVSAQAGPKRLKGPELSSKPLGLGVHPHKTLTLPKIEPLASPSKVLPLGVHPHKVLTLPKSASPSASASASASATGKAPVPASVFKSKKAAYKYFHLIRRSNAELESEADSNQSAERDGTLEPRASSSSDYSGYSDSSRSSASSSKSTATSRPPPPPPEARNSHVVRPTPHRVIYNIPHRSYQRIRENITALVSAKKAARPAAQPARILNQPKTSTSSHSKTWPTPEHSALHKAVFPGKQQFPVKHSSGYKGFQKSLHLNSVQDGGVGKRKGQLRTIKVRSLSDAATPALDETPDPVEEGSNETLELVSESPPDPLVGSSDHIEARTSDSTNSETSTGSTARNTPGRQTMAVQRASIATQRQQASESTQKYNRLGTHQQILSLPRTWPSPTIAAMSKVLRPGKQQFPVKHSRMYRNFEKSLHEVRDGGVKKIKTGFPGHLPAGVRPDRPRLSGRSDDVGKDAHTLTKSGSPGRNADDKTESSKIVEVQKVQRGGQSSPSTSSESTEAKPQTSSLVAESGRQEDLGGEHDEVDNENDDHDDANNDLERRSEFQGVDDERGELERRAGDPPIGSKRPFGAYPQGSQKVPKVSTSTPEHQAPPPGTHPHHTLTLPQTASYAAPAHPWPAQGVPKEAHSGKQQFPESHSSGYRAFEEKLHDISGAIHKGKLPRRSIVEDTTPDSGANVIVERGNESNREGENDDLMKRSDALPIETEKLERRIMLSGLKRLRGPESAIGDGLKKARAEPKPAPLGLGIHPHKTLVLPKIGPAPAPRTPWPSPATAASGKVYQPGKKQFPDAHNSGYKGFQNDLHRVAQGAIGKVRGKNRRRSLSDDALGLPLVDTTEEADDDEDEDNGGDEDEEYRVARAGEGASSSSRPPKKRPLEPGGSSSPPAAKQPRGKEAMTSSGGKPPLHPNGFPLYPSDIVPKKPPRVVTGPYPPMKEKKPWPNRGSIVQGKQDLPGKQQFEPKHSSSYKNYEKSLHKIQDGGVKKPDHILKKPPGVLDKMVKLAATIQRTRLYRFSHAGH